MPKTLVIAEKPSVAADIASALGKIPKTSHGFFENERYIITFAIGHLLELCLPGELDKKRGKWSFANLPILPDSFELKPVPKNESQVKLIARLLKRPDVTDLVNACDAGREGELIFLYITQYLNNKKPVSRLWLDSLLPEVIRDGFANLAPGQKYQDLGDAAICRSESDWLVGINSTRALTAFNSQGGGFTLTPVGRVQTPTLAILAEREEKIRNFSPRDFWEVFADFGVESGEYRGRWFDPLFQKDKKETDEHAKPERIWDKQKALEIAAKCKGKPATVSEEKKPTSQSAPPLFDLTSLQREANARFGFSAKQTLQIAQALYERHKALTYPRTDSRYLTPDFLPTVKKTLSSLQDPSLAPHARTAINSGWIRPSCPVFNRAKVSDHHAIIPTGHHPKSLNDAEAKIFDLVCKRFIAVFFPPAKFEITKRISVSCGESFRTDGKIITDPGWQIVYGKQADTGDAIVPIAKNETAQTLATEAKDLQTRPPARFNEATLLASMESAGKLVDDEDLRDAMSERGLGTPATRSSIIEGLVAQTYIFRQGKDLIVTQKGISLITALRSIGIDALTSPEMTGEWEFRLKQMEQGKIPRPQFMADIREFTEKIVAQVKNHSGEIVSDLFSDLPAHCPKCGNEVFKESFKAYECTSCALIIWKTMAGRELEREEIKHLLENGSVGPLEGFRSKMGRPFSATVRLDSEGKQSFDFGNDSKDSDRVFDFTQLPQVAPCTACNKGFVYDAGDAFVCEHAVGSAKSCTFRMGKTILQREIPAEQVRKLLETGKTDLLPRFISKKGKPFSAFLKYGNGKVGFEFEERAPSKKKSASSTTKEKTEKPATSPRTRKPKTSLVSATRKTTAKPPAKTRAKA